MIRFAILSLLILSCSACGGNASLRDDSAAVASEANAETQATCVNVFHGCKSHN